MIDIDELRNNHAHLLTPLYRGEKEPHIRFPISTFYELLDLAQKQVPKHPSYEYGNTGCPECGANIKDCLGYCDECGQAIEWGMDDD